MLRGNISKTVLVILATATSIYLSATTLSSASSSSSSHTCFNKKQVSDPVKGHRWKSVVQHRCSALRYVSVQGQRRSGRSPSSAHVISSANSMLRAKCLLLSQALSQKWPRARRYHVKDKAGGRKHPTSSVLSKLDAYNGCDALSNC